MGNTMRIAHISDVHLDVNSEVVGSDILEQFIEVLSEESWDVLLISGDISNSIRETLFVLDEIKLHTGKEVLFVPGNHDLCTEWGMTEEVYADYLSHESVIIGRPKILDGRFAVVGALGWYDYSYAPEQDVDLMARLKQSYWWDGSKIHFEGSDPEVMWKHLHALKADLDRAKDLPVWVMTHFVPYRDFLVYKDPIWNICNGFIGSEEVGRLIDNYENVQYVSFGHTHKRFGVQEKNGKSMIVNPLGYYEEWTGSDFKEEIKKCLKFIEV